MHGSSQELQQTFFKINGDQCGTNVAGHLTHRLLTVFSLAVV